MVEFGVAMKWHCPKESFQGFQDKVIDAGNGRGRRCSRWKRFNEEKFSVAGMQMEQ
jgi:hypothetical protein